MKRTLNKEQARLLAAEWKKTGKERSSIKMQFEKMVNSLLLEDKPDDQKIEELREALQCVRNEFSYFADGFRSYSRRNGKLKEEAEKDSAENLEQYALIRQQAEAFLLDVEAISTAAFRQVRIKQMAQGIFVLPPQPEQQQKDAQFPPAPDEESGK